MTTVTASDETTRERAVETALARLDLETRVRLVDGLDMWALPALPEIGLRSLVMSDGPVGVRGTVWSGGGPTVMLPSPTALAATWDPELARRAGHVLAQEARRKGVHVLLAPTVNLHRSPLGGRHFECYSEDPLLTGEIAAGYVTGVQEGGVAAMPKHFVANDAETDRFTVDVRVDERTLRELYLAPFEVAVRRAGAWAAMSAYNSVNGSTMTEHAPLQRRLLKDEWAFDGCVVSDWMAARDAVRAALGGLDVAMPGVLPVFRNGLADAVRAGTVPEAVVADMARRTLRLAARAGALDGVPPAAAPAALPAPVDGGALARELAARSFVLLRNDGVLPLDPAALRAVALAGEAAGAPAAMGGGSAEVGSAAVVSPLAGLRGALPGGVAVTYAAGAGARTRVAPAGADFELTAVFRDRDGRALAEQPLASGLARWLGDLPGGVAQGELRSVEVAGAFTPQVGGRHRFAVEGAGAFRLEVGGREVFDGVNLVDDDDGPGAAFLHPPSRVVEVELAAGAAVDVSLRHTIEGALPFPAVSFTLGHAGPAVDPDDLLAEAAAAAAAADVAVVVVGTTEETEREGADRETLALPGRQDELVRRVAAANPRTVVVVNAGSPVELPWADEVAAVLLAWFPGQEGGAALADVLLGRTEPGGRLPTTWPARLADCPVSRVTPVDGVLAYDEGVFIGYRAWERAAAPPAFWFGHGLGYTSWAYESASFTSGGGDALGVLRVRVRNTGPRAGREVVQAYLAPAEPEADRPRRWLAGFATAAAAPGEAAEVAIAVPRRAAETWDAAAGAWRLRPGAYALETGRSYADRRLVTPIAVGG
ncbi:MAG: glycoside hydrolase family 3 protein [Chloroflexi bacterium]|nr:MAG: glycoside hydrolase family 3 protein [Chloroflexota bacterium]